MIEGGVFTAILGIVVVLGVILALKRNGKRKSGRRHPPSLPALPIVGSLPFLGVEMSELPEKFRKISENLGPIFSFYSGRNLSVVLNGKEAIVNALHKQAEVFADRGNIWTEENIFNTERKGIGFAHYNEAFKKSRKLSLSILKEFGFGVSRESDSRIWNEVGKMITTIRDYNGRQFNPKILMTRMTANVTMNILFGEEFQSMENDLHNIIDGACQFLHNMDPAIDAAPLIRYLPMYRKKIANMKKATETMMAGLDVAIKHNKSAELTQSTFTKRYLEIEGPNYDHQALLFILRDLCLGSSDTASLRLLWLMVDMVNHSDVKDRVQKEIDEVVPEYRLPSYEDKLQLPFTEATILETARFHTLGPFAIPRATLRETEVCGYLIPKGVAVIPNMYSVSMDPSFWIDPENYRPERFLDKERNVVVRRDDIILFGLGKRACLGEALAKQEVFIFFSSLMQHFDMQPPEGQASIDVVNEQGLAVGPSDYKIRLVPRKYH